MESTAAQPHWKKSWQAVAIAPHPQHSHRPGHDIFSLHMLGYLIHGAAHAQEHHVIVGDAMKAVNYQAIHGLSAEEAYQAAVKRGKEKADTIESVCNTYGLENVYVSQFERIKDDVAPIRDFIMELYEREDSFRQEVENAIPNALKEQTGAGQLASYVIDEIALTLYTGSTRLTHRKEPQLSVNKLAQQLYGEFGEEIGNHVQLEPLPAEPSLTWKETYEPYSLQNPHDRLLLTDDVTTFKGKREHRNHHARRKQQWLEDVVSCKVNDSAFYDTVVWPGYERLAYEAGRYHEEKDSNIA